MIEYGGPDEWAASTVGAGWDDRVAVATHMVVRAVHVDRTPGVTGAMWAGRAVQMPGQSDRMGMIVVGRSPPRYHNHSGWAYV